MGGRRADGGRPGTTMPRTRPGRGRRSTRAVADETRAGHAAESLPEKYGRGIRLYQVLSRYDGQAVCAIALPFTERYTKPVRNILLGIQWLGLHMLFLSEGEMCISRRTQQDFSRQNLSLW